MVKVAVAGGTGNVATELLRPAIASGNHEITILTRSMPNTRIPGVSYKVVDYASLPSLTLALSGLHTCLSFLLTHLDTHSLAQKSLIKACIAARLTRFAPSEWSLRNNNGCPSYANKDAIASYLSEVDAAGELGGLQASILAGIHRRITQWTGQTVFL
ncbi:hypothetical protein GRF29_8g3406223 [Pseudopithomyces chartarum]|uniref:NmrA-like domain-containing protein n=1 Tax=Pseudopithomyces chartarum TaxID=1892770 RepID=A0AAN6M8D2_9PLEO|nr:hypothetical protein GRF29_8g3406223 [Pseudopithomyces chartarum]